MVMIIITFLIFSKNIVRLILRAACDICCGQTALLACIVEWFTSTRYVQPNKKRVATPLAKYVSFICVCDRNIFLAGTASLQPNWYY